MIGPFDNELDNLEWERGHMQSEVKPPTMCDCSPSHTCSEHLEHPNEDPLMAKAWELTNGDRRASYGNPAEVFDAYGMAWTAVLRQKLKPGETITGLEVTLMMAMLKILREAQQVKADNVVDCHGYLSLHSRVAGLVENK